MRQPAVLSKLRSSAQGLLRLLSAKTIKSTTEVKPSNKRGAHYLVGLIRKMGVFTDGGYHFVGFVREKGGFADRGIPESRTYQSRIWIPRIRNPAIQDPPISESRNPTIRNPPISESGTQQPEIQQSRNPIPRAYLIPYFFRIFTIGFLIDSAQRV